MVCCGAALLRLCCGFFGICYGLVIILIFITSCGGFVRVGARSQKKIDLFFGLWFRICQHPWTIFGLVGN